MQKISLEAFLKKHFTLYLAYWAKEKLRDIYHLTIRKEAEEALTSLIILMEKSEDFNLVDWSRTLKRHKEYILNFFDNRTTNGYTEGVNSKLDMIKRVSFGFRNIDTYVRKAVLAFLPISFVNQYHTFCN